MDGTLKRGCVIGFLEKLHFYMSRKGTNFGKLQKGHKDPIPILMNYVYSSLRKLIFIVRWIKFDWIRFFPLQ